MQLLRVPGSILAPPIIVFGVVGAYTLSNNVAEVVIMIAFGIVGYLLRKIKLDPAPLVLAFVLGNILETNFRQALRSAAARSACSIRGGSPRRGPASRRSWSCFTSRAARR